MSICIFPCSISSLPSWIFICVDRSYGKMCKRRKVLLELCMLCYFYRRVSRPVSWFSYVKEVEKKCELLTAKWCGEKVKVHWFFLTRVMLVRKKISSTYTWISPEAFAISIYLIPAKFIIKFSLFFHFFGKSFSHEKQPEE